MTTEHGWLCPHREHSTGECGPMCECTEKIAKGEYGVVTAEQRSTHEGEHRWLDPDRDWQSKWSVALVEINRLTVEVEWLREANADDIRAQGWTVAVHNDYRSAGLRHTFWLFTKNGRAIKGEGRTDTDALAEVRQQIV